MLFLYSLLFLSRPLSQGREQLYSISSYKVNCFLDTKLEEEDVVKMCKEMLANSAEKLTTQGQSISVDQAKLVSQFLGNENPERQHPHLRNFKQCVINSSPVIP